MWRIIREDDGQDMIEYAFLIVFIALAAAVFLPATHTAVSSVFAAINTRLSAAS